MRTQFVTLSPCRGASATVDCSFVVKQEDRLTGSILESQIPSLFTHEQSEDIPYNVGEGSGQRRRGVWSHEEDLILISAWLGTSKDPIVGTNQLWNRIADEYNGNCGGLNNQSRIQLKNHFHKLSSAVNKFSRIFKGISERHPSGCSESDIMFEAHKMYRQEAGKRFSYEHAWRKLKDEPKWRVEPQLGCSKRTKISEFGPYISTSNSETLKSSENDGTSKIPICPMNQNPVEKKEKAKGERTSKNVVIEKMDNFCELERDKLNVLKQMNELQKEFVHLQEYELLLKDTSTMTNRQREDYEQICNLIKQKHGM